MLSGQRRGCLSSWGRTGVLLRAWHEDRGSRPREALTGLTVLPAQGHPWRVGAGPPKRSPDCAGPASTRASDQPRASGRAALSAPASSPGRPSPGCPTKVARTPRATNFGSGREAWLCSRQPPALPLPTIRVLAAGVFPQQHQTLTLTHRPRATGPMGKRNWKADPKETPWPAQHLPRGPGRGADPRDGGGYGWEPQHCTVPRGKPQQLPDPPTLGSANGKAGGTAGTSAVGEAAWHVPQSTRSAPASLGFAFSAHFSRSPRSGGGGADGGTVSPSGGWVSPSHPPALVGAPRAYSAPAGQGPLPWHSGHCVALKGQGRGLPASCASLWHLS